MIVDVHTHTPKYKEVVPAEEVEFNTAWRPDRAVKIPVTWCEHMEAMTNVDRAIVFPIPQEPYASLNNATAEFVQAHPSKLIGFLSVDPRDPGALEEIDRCVSTLGLRGVKLGPNYQSFDPCGPEAFAVYARAEKLGLPIMFHAGTSPVREAPLDYAHPRHMDSIAIAFPDLKIVLAHMAHPWQPTAIAVIRKHPNVYADISALFYRPWSFYNCMRLATEWGVLHKLLFGTDYPVTTPQETMEALRRPNAAIEGTTLPPVPEQAMEEIIGRNALALLGLED